VMAPDVPWLSHFRRSVDIAVGPYEEITEFMKKHPEHIEQAFETLSYRQHEPGRDGQQRLLFRRTLG
jgi:cephalosporin-C deacetylase-like acetyl esterase